VARGTPVEKMAITQQQLNRIRKARYRGTRHSLAARPTSLTWKLLLHRSNDEVSETEEEGNGAEALNKLVQPHQERNILSI